MPISTT